jgi:hypothetical protein
LEQLPADGCDHPHRLAFTGRFRHNATYVLAALMTAGLVDGDTYPNIPRLECGKPVDGLLVSARALVGTSEVASSS